MGEAEDRSSGKEDRGSGGELNPWRTHATEVVYENPWIRVEHSEVTRPDGQPGIYGVVHFKNRAVGVIPVDAEDHTWLVGQFRYTLGRYEWEIPEGGSPEHESLEETAHRELFEEAGIRAGRMEMLISSFETSNSVCNETGCVFVAYDLSFHAPEPEGTEQIAIRRVPLEEAFRMVDEGVIRDSMSVAGLLKLRVKRLEAAAQTA